ncbi:MAG TPA: protein kinase, partial [Burkholderiales bacterium]|nr:protein kinase [Burkholderiales bacterium]
MGVVYEGVDPRLGRRVAIKTILKSLLDENTAKDYSLRFVREAQAVARLNHPNIVQVYDFGEEGDIAYLVMEFIKGRELKASFEANERFDLKEAVRIMGELCDALDFAHNAGIIHRDIKPANVMLDAQARTKLTDFGVARVQDSDKTSVERTQAGTMVGTPAYMSPEQITGGNIDKRSDVFSAGVILYQFLTGEKPFTGGGAWTVAKKILQEEPPLPSSLNNAITPLFDAVVNKALAKNPEQRFQSARDLAAALNAALEGKVTQDDADKTVAQILPQTAPVPRTDGSQTASTEEVELEFWRAIKDGTDPDDFELYVKQFPTGIYAALAKRKIAKLRGLPLEESGARAIDQEKTELEEAARREAKAKAKLEAEKARLEAEMARREVEYEKRVAEAEAKPASKRLAIGLAATVGAVVLAIAGAVIFFLPKEDPEAAARLQSMQKELEQAKQKEQQARIALEKARAAEAQAKKSGDLAKQKALAEARAKAEAEAKAHGDATKAAEQQKLAAEKAARARAKTDTAAKTKADAEAQAKAKAAEEAKTSPAADANPFQTAKALDRAGNGKEAVKAYMAAVKTGNCDAA